MEAGIFITPGSLSDPVLPWLLRGTLASNFTFQFAESGSGSRTVCVGGLLREGLGVGVSSELYLEEVKDQGSLRSGHISMCVCVCVSVCLSVLGAV